MPEPDFTIDPGLPEPAPRLDERIVPDPVVAPDRGRPTPPEAEVQNLEPLRTEVGSQAPTSREQFLSAGEETDDRIDTSPEAMELRRQFISKGARVEPSGPQARGLAERRRRALDIEERTNIHLAEMLGTTPEQFGQPGLENWWVRMKIAAAETQAPTTPGHLPRGFQTYGEKLAALHGSYEQAELFISEPFGDLPSVTMVRLSPEHPWRRLDDITNRSPVETGRDIAEFFAPILGATIGETLGVLVKINPSGRVVTSAGRQAAQAPGIRGRLTRMKEAFLDWQARARNNPETKFFNESPVFRLSAGAAAGRFTQEQVEAALGFQQQSGLEVGLQVSGDYATALVFGKLGEVVGTRFSDLAEGRGLLARRMGADEAIGAAKGVKEFAEEVGPRARPFARDTAPPSFMLVRSPAATGMGQQSRAMISLIPEYMDNLVHGLVSIARVHVDNFMKNAPDFISTLRSAERSHAANTLAKVTNRLSVSLSKKTDAEIQAGITPAVEGVKKYMQDSFVRVGLAYARADRTIKSISTEGLTFDMTTPSVSSGSGQQFVGQGVHDVARDIIHRFTHINDQGKRVALEGAEAIVQLAADARAHKKEVRGERIFDSVSGKFYVKTPLEVLQDLQERANVISMSSLPGQADKKMQLMAGNLRSKLENVMDNPTNTVFFPPGTMDPKAKLALEQLRTARAMASERFTNLEMQAVTMAAGAQTPIALASKFTNIAKMPGGNPAADWALQLKKVLPTKEWRDLQASAIADLLRDPYQLRAKLDAADPRVLENLLNSHDISVLQKAADEFAHLGQAGLQSALSNQVMLGAAISDMVLKNNTAGIDAVFQIMQANGGHNGPFGRVIRAGLWDALVGMRKTIDGRRVRGRLVDLDAGVESFDPGKLSAVIDLLGQTGADRLFTKEEFKFLSNTNLIMDFIRVASDAGTSLQRAETISNLRSVLTAPLPGHKKNSMGAILTFMEHVGVGHLMVSKAGRFLISGTGLGKSKIDEPFFEFMFGKDSPISLNLTPRNVTTAMGAAAGQAATSLEASQSLLIETINLAERFGETLAELPDTIENVTSGMAGLLENLTEIGRARQLGQEQE